MDTLTLTRPHESPKVKHHRASYFARTGFFHGIKNFQDLESKIYKLDHKKDKGDAFEIFAEAYLNLFHKNDFQQVWPLKSAPNQKLHQIALDGADFGVDGLVEDKSGGLSAYQVKFRSHRPTLTWRELSTFIGLADSPNIKHKILITNCDAIPSILDKRFGFYCIRGSDFDRLTESDFQVIAKAIEGDKPTPVKKRPRPYQQDALDALIPALQKNDRVSAIMACGTGKTLVALWLAENPDFKKILVLLPSLALIRQTLHEWRRENNWESMSYISVCSDKSIQDEDENEVSSHSLLDFPVTTSPHEIRTFLDSNESEVKVVFSTYQSARMVSSAMHRGESFDFGIFDEAHKTTGKQGRRFSHALHDHNLPINKRLFLTATPRTFSPKSSEQKIDPLKVQSMDNAELYGPQAFTLNFGKAVEEKIICPYKVIVTVITSDMVDNELLERGEVRIGNDSVNARVVANQIAIKKTLEEYGPKKIFTFHHTVEQAQRFTGNETDSIANHISGYDLFHVNGKMTTFDREKILREFKHSPNGIISNARCLTEGVDVPAVDMVAFLSPKKSSVDIVQATGRAMRLSRGKEMGYILVPIYIELKKNETVEEAVERASFEEVWNVLQAMLDQDEQLYHAVQEVAKESGRGKELNCDYFDDKIEITGGMVQIEDIVESIRIRTLKEFFESWRIHIGTLIQFFEDHGHYDIPKTKDTSRLRRWITLQRKNKRRGTIDPAIEFELEKIHFDWKSFSWEQNLKSLVDFKSKYGHFEVPFSYGSNELGAWVRKIRDDRKKRQVGRELVAELNAINFDWFGTRKSDEIIKKIVKYRDQYGHHEIDRDSEDPELIGLGDWIFNIRKAKVEGTLDKELMYKLYDARFSFVPKININSAMGKLFD